MLSLKGLVETNPRNADGPEKAVKKVCGMESCMDKIYVVYWSQSGNTQAMAEAIGQGITEAGREAAVVYVGETSAGELQDAACFALGCPAMGAEELEDSEMEPFVQEVEKFAAGKTIALFGSYGWGDGEWMRSWTDRMSGCGATVLNGEGLICQGMPDEAGLAECKALGGQLASC